jgi:hypothetical protein
MRAYYIRILVWRLCCDLKGQQEIFVSYGQYKRFPVWYSIVHQQNTKNRLVTKSSLN